MSFMEQFLPAECDLLIRLPYRVGLYVSQSDRSGGDDSDEVEKRVLSNIITAYSQEVFGAETAQYIITETVSCKADWEEWSLDLEHIQEECGKAIGVLNAHVAPKEVSAFKRCLMEIGESVALAFCEYDDGVSLIEKTKIYMAYRRSRSMAAKLGIVAKEWDQFINISLDERDALQRIAVALDTSYA